MIKKSRNGLQLFHKYIIAAIKRPIARVIAVTGFKSAVGLFKIVDARFIAAIAIFSPPKAIVNPKTTDLNNSKFFIKNCIIFPSAVRIGMLSSFPKALNAFGMPSNNLGIILSSAFFTFLNAITTECTSSSADISPFKKLSHAAFAEPIDPETVLIASSAVVPVMCISSCTVCIA